MQEFEAKFEVTEANIIAIFIALVVTMVTK
jgi:hypothetical protein